MTQRRWRHSVAGLVVTLVALAGCGTDSAAEKERPDVTSTSSSDTPGADVAMETVLADYRAMRTEMVAALDAELGTRAWDVSANNPTAVRAGCRAGEAEDGERVALESFSFRGTYDSADWRRSAEIVEEVGRTHGFTTTGTVVDADDDLQVFGEDDQGGRYVYGLSTNTVLGISTGCHVWTSKPTAESPGGEDEVEIPEYDKSDG